MTPTTKRSIPIATNNPNPPVSSRLTKPIMINIMPRTTHTNVKVTMLPYLLAAISRTPTRACTGQVALWLDHKHLLHRQCLQPPTKPDQTPFPQRDPRLLPRLTRRAKKGGLLRRVFLSTPIASAYSFSHLHQSPGGMVDDYRQNAHHGRPTASGSAFCWSRTCNS